MAEVLHLVVGVWHGPLCGLGQPQQGLTGTFTRARVTCPACLVTLDLMEQEGVRVKARLHWVEAYARKEDGRWCEVVWRAGRRPTPARARRAKAQGHELARVPVLDARSLQAQAHKLTR